MKKLLLSGLFFMLILALSGCSSAPEAQAPAVSNAAEQENPVTIDFGSSWTGNVRIEKEPLSESGVTARFYSEWTLGESAGNVYPKGFTLVETGSAAEMNFRWDNGGDIEAGIYDVLVDVDGIPGKGTIKNLKLDDKTEYTVYISFSAAYIDIPLETDGDDIFMFPAGTHDKYENLGRLDDIPEELLINHINSYNDNNPIWKLIPAGVPLDILRTYSNGKSEWITDYTAVSESFIKKLP